jgi:GT2 family glycosyltransferase
MNKKKVSIIILNYNETKLTLHCLASLAKITYLNYEIILVDNGSKEDIEPLIKQKPRNVIIIKNKINLGYAEGNNVGYQKASGEYILFLNNDTVVEKDFLKPLVTALENDKQLAAVQPKIMQYPRKEFIDSVGSYFLFSGFLYHLGHNKKDKKKYHKEGSVFSMKGACMLFKKEVLDEIGVFDKDYFAYFEETDLCHRVWLAGYKIFYIPSATIYHEGGQTSKKLQSAFVQFHSYKNRIYTYMKNFQLSTLVRVLPLHLFLCEVITLLYVVTGKFPLAFAIQKALFWNLFHMNMIIKQRKQMKKLRKINDSVYLPKVTKKVRVSYYYHLFATSLAGYKD